MQLSETAYRGLIFTASKQQTRTSAELDSRGRQRALTALTGLGYVARETVSQATADRRERRLKDFGAIHMGKRALSLSDTDDRALVARANHGKSRSCAPLNAKERGGVLKVLRAKEFAHTAA